jgi:ankyrin repeat protein
MKKLLLLSTVIVIHFASIQMSAMTTLNLLNAIGDSDMNTIDSYVNAGFNMNQIDDFTGETPLSQAVKRHEFGIVEKLIVAGADVNFSTLQDLPLHIAIKYDLLKMVRLLLDAGADVVKQSPQRDNAICLAFRRTIKKDLHERHAEEINNLIQKKAAGTLEIDRKPKGDGDDESKA